MGEGFALQRGSYVSVRGAQSDGWPEGISPRWGSKGRSPMGGVRGAAVFWLRRRRNPQGVEGLEGFTRPLFILHV
jgi:hypothetical protein